MLPPIPISSQGLFLSFIAGSFFYFSYKINEELTSWAVYSQGISLIYLPAGIKHLSILLANGWGALGCFAALFLLASDFWYGIHPLIILCYSLVSTCATWLGVWLSLKIFGITNDLGNLKFIHLPQMDFITATIHAIIVNVFFIATSMKTSHDKSNYLAMFLGDYIGSFIILSLFWLSLIFLSKTSLKR
jgi:hypothetical protein